MNFLLQTKTCIVNSRINPLEDGFTSVSHRGKAVVDYVMTTHEGIHHIEHFRVISVTDLITEINLQQLCTAKVSDHNILECVVSLDRHLDEFRIGNENCVQNET